MNLIINNLIEGVQSVPFWLAVGSGWFDSSRKH